MRSTLFSLALAVAALAFVAAPDARAQWGPGVSVYYGPTYYPPVSYYDPGVYYAPSYSYAPPYYWYGSYYTAPLSRGWAYQSYYPYTNQYYYSYRMYPRYWRRW
jgi:hypothetical protein